MTIFKYLLQIINLRLYHIFLFHQFKLLGHTQIKEITKPYFDDDNMSSSEDASDLEFVRPSKEWEEEPTKQHR